MEKMGFTDKWTFLVMNCVRAIKCSILINGQAYRMITPIRGLRQEDPLSPYFFILCVEGLSTTLNEVE